MSTNKMREVLEQAHDLSLDGRHEEARAAILEALADDDAERGTMQEAFEAWCPYKGSPDPWIVWQAAWQASRAAAPQSVEPACRDDGRCQYAIDHGAEGLGHCPKGKCAMPSAPAASQPIDMVLHCPACGKQHIDAPEVYEPIAYSCECRGPDQCEGCYYAQRDWEEWKSTDPWTNPPHRSHLCSGCGHIWRPADVPTNGIQAVATKGKNDSPINAAAPQSVEPVAGAVWNGKEVMLVRLGEEDSYLRKGCSRLHLAPPSAPTDAAWRAENERLRVALRFYARGEHYNLDESEEFDTVSGEPENWLCSGVEDSSTMIENGRVALFALRGIEANWIDGDEDCTPQPVEGEKALRAHIATRPAQAEEWIACSERMPNPDFGEVLVWLWESKMYAIDEWHTYHEDPTGMGGPTLDMGLMWRNFDFDEVSHWRPLPAPPTKTKEPGA